MLLDFVWPRVQRGGDKIGRVQYQFSVPKSYIWEPLTACEHICKICCGNTSKGTAVNLALNRIIEDNNMNGGSNKWIIPSIHHLCKTSRYTFFITLLT